MNLGLFKFYLKRELFSRWEFSFLILLSIALGVGSVIGIHSYKDNIKSAIQKEAKNLMGADLALQSPQEVTEEATSLVDRTLPSGSETSSSIQFLSMVISANNEENSLSYIKAVETNYPFYGQFETEPKDAYRKLSSREILLEKNLGENLKVRLGDSVRLGESSLRVSGWILKEPGAVGSFVGSAPTSVILQETAKATGLIQRGSRIRFTIFAKIPTNIDSLGWKEKHFEELIKNDLTIYHNTEVNSGSQQFLTNTFDYMSLLALAGFFLGAISVYTTIRTRLREKKNEIAVMKCLGAEPKIILGLVISEIFIVSLLGTGIGLWIGYEIQILLPSFTGSEFLGTITPGISFSSLLWSLLLGIFVPLLVALPLVIEAGRIKPLLALKEVESREQSTGDKRLVVFSSLGIYLLFFILASYETDSFLKGSIFSLILVSLPLLVFGLFKLFGLLMIRFTKWGLVSKEWSLVTKKIIRKSGSMRLSILGLGSALFILCLSLVLQESLMELSGAREIDRRPNVFLLDIKEDQRENIETIFAKYPVQKKFVSPIIGARLAKVNGEPVKKEDTIRNAMERNWRATARTREYFLSYREELYETEKVTSGEWWDSSKINEISVEKDFSGYLKAGVGDTLTFNVQGVEVLGKITNLRSVNWSDMKPNFVVIFSKGTLEKAPRFYISSLLLEKNGDRYQLQKEVVSKYPNVTVIDTEKTVQAFMGILEKVTQMIRLMTGFILASSLLLVLTSLYSSQLERKKEFALLRVIGARSRYLSLHFAREGILIATVSFLIGLVYSLVSNEILNRFVLELTSVIPWGSLTIVFAVVVCITLLLYASGLIALFRLPPKTLLKEVR
ncbi:ABC transporter permease [Leptospira ilyithenensis]|uniref:FtsX-like permease family protein n=1 Tax=Leptospira ilyithenensis TaxID=2484901 RepID=A0A4R9LKI2_9LEPT|nr:FtsX-like permease family protein [Leptospira ilyithenensis]TGN06514.1 FtsX-like permease family protein [Leptospira ilyithenensis]